MDQVCQKGHEPLVGCLQENEGQEADLHDQLHKVTPQVAQVVKTKNLVAFKRMLQHIEYPDVRAAELMVEGFPLIGSMDKTGVFEERPLNSVVQGADSSWLYLSAKQSRRDLITEIQAQEMTPVLREVYKKTVGTPESEVERGWASGPFTEEEVTQRLGPLWIPCRRFGVDQGEKIRQIDDFSECFHNACVTMTDKVTVSGVDAIANFSKCWAECIHMAKHDAQGKWRFRLTLDSGQTITRVIHPDFRKEVGFVGKVLDLESAYKQCPVRPSHQHLSVCAMKDPESNQVRFFEMHALPFGATAAVHGFNRAAMALEHILTKLFGIPCTHYFDDFTFIGPDSIMPAVVDMAKDVLSLLGWSVKGGDKDKPLAPVFKALGVEFDLSKMSDPLPTLEVVNTKSRIEAICAAIDEILHAKTMTSGQAQRLAGKLGFARSQLFGRVGAVALRVLHKRAVEWPRRKGSTPRQNGPLVGGEEPYHWPNPGSSAWQETVNPSSFTRTVAVTLTQILSQESVRATVRSCSTLRTMSMNIFVKTCPKS